MLIPRSVDNDPQRRFPKAFGQEHLRKAQADSAVETIFEGGIASSTSADCPANFKRDRNIARSATSGRLTFIQLLIGSHEGGAPNSRHGLKRHDERQR